MCVVLLLLFVISEDTKLWCQALRTVLCVMYICLTVSSLTYTACVDLIKPFRRGGAKKVEKKKTTYGPMAVRKDVPT